MAGLARWALAPDVRTDVQVLSGSTSEHTYGVLLKQLASLDVPSWIDVIAETRTLGSQVYVGVWVW